MDTLRSAKAKLLGYQQRWPLLHKIIEVWTRLPSQFQQVFKSGGGDERRAGALSLKERIRRHRRTVHKGGASSPPFPFLPHSKVAETLGYRLSGVTGSRRYFMDTEPFRCEAHEVCEGTPRINANYKR